MLQLALDETRLHPNEHAPAVAGAALETIAQHYRRALHSQQRLARYLPPLVLEAMLIIPH